MVGSGLMVGEDLWTLDPPDLMNQMDLDGPR